jgi:anti-anti-sigma factor
MTNAFTSPRSAAAQERPQHQIARFATRWLQPSTAVISVHGELDAANAEQFSEHVLPHLRHTNRLVLDLSGVEFFATAGFAAVHTVSERAAAEDVEWLLVPSRSVSRLLKICDPGSALQLCEDVDEAMTRLLDRPSPLLQLVSKSS